MSKYENLHKNNADLFVIQRQNHIREQKCFSIKDKFVHYFGFAQLWYEYKEKECNFY